MIERKQYGTQETLYQKLFHTPGLMRYRISPEANQMIIYLYNGWIFNYYSYFGFSNTSQRSYWF